MPSALRIRLVSPEVRRCLFEALPLRLRLVSRFFYATGYRISEAAAVRFEHCRDNGEPVLTRLAGKGGKERTVRIPLGLAQEIEAGFQARKERERIYLFETRFGNRYTRQYVSLEIERAAMRVLGRTITAHDLRHSRGTDVYARTRDLKGIAEFLGHMDTSTTARYYVQSVLCDEQLFEGEEL
jgi:integrase